MSRRQQHDEHLTLADTAIAIGDLAEADRRLDEVAREPANEVAAAWAALGQTEILATTEPLKARAIRERLHARAGEVGAD
jgi:hypothetical protein